MITGETELAKPKRADVASAPDERWVVYRGGHPLIRRCGVVLRPGAPTLVPGEIAEMLIASGDVEPAAAPPSSE
jgi:hypothetical protein